MITVLIVVITYILMLAVTAASFYIGYKFAETKVKGPETKERSLSDNDRLRMEGIKNIMNHALRHKRDGD